MHKIVTRGCKFNMTLTESIDARNVLSRCRLKLCDFSINYKLNCSVCSRLSTYHDKCFSSITLINFAKCNANRWNNARDSHQYRHKWGSIGPSFLFCEHGDLSFLLHFSKQCMVGNIRGKFKKNRSTTFISEKSPWDMLTYISLG